MAVQRPPVPDDDRVRALLADRVDVQRKSVGMVVGILTRDGCRVVSHGQVDHADPRPLNGDTIFELASITKVFTALLLADMVERGEVALDDPVQRYVPAGVKIPTRKGREIALVDLATHTSALPILPDDAPNLDDPAMADYSVERLYRSISSCTLARDIGSQWGYSNIDYALIGHALAHRAGLSYADLVRTRIIERLGLTATSIDVTPALAPRMTVSHDSNLRPIPRMALGAMTPAGGMVSSANDLLRFLSVCLDLTASPLSPALHRMLESRRPFQPPMLAMLRQHWRMMLRMLLSGGLKRPADPRIVTEQAIGWYVHRHEGEEMILHDGAGPSCATSMAYDPQRGVGVVVLSNTGSAVADISRHLLWGWPLTPARRQVRLDPERLDRYTGEYESGTSRPFRLFREGERLFADFPFLGTIELRPQNEREFFIIEHNMVFRFKANARGKATTMFFQPFPGQPEMPLRRLR